MNDAHIHLGQWGASRSAARAGRLAARGHIDRRRRRARPPRRRDAAAGHLDPRATGGTSGSSPSASPIRAGG